jgi:hypothetical protein
MRQGKLSSGLILRSYREEEGGMAYMYNPDEVKSDGKGNINFRHTWYTVTVQGR